MIKKLWKIRKDRTGRVIIQGMVTIPGFPVRKFSSRLSVLYIQWTQRGRLFAIEIWCQVDPVDTIFWFPRRGKSHFLECLCGGFFAKVCVTASSSAFFFDRIFEIQNLLAKTAKNKSRVCDSQYYVKHTLHSQRWLIIALNCILMMLYSMNTW